MTPCNHDLSLPDALYVCTRSNGQTFTVCRQCKLRQSKETMRRRRQKEREDKFLTKSAALDLLRTDEYLRQCVERESLPRYLRQ